MLLEFIWVSFEGKMRDQVDMFESFNAEIVKV